MVASFSRLFNEFNKLYRYVVFAFFTSTLPNIGLSLTMMMLELESVEFNSKAKWQAYKNRLHKIYFIAT